MTDRLYILTSFDFNHVVGAAWSRVKSYAEAIQNTSTEVYIASSNYDLKKEHFFLRGSGNIFEIHSSKTAKKRKSYIKNFLFLYYFRHYISLIKISEAQESRKTIFLLYSFNFAAIIMALLVFRILKRRQIYVEKNELQMGIALNQVLPLNVKKYLPALFLKIIMIAIGFLQDIFTINFDGIIVISNRLRSLYSKTNKKIISIPILANDVFFQINRDTNRNQEFKICYTGDINQQKDGILSFLAAIMAIRNKRLICDFYGNIKNDFRTKMNILIKANDAVHSIRIYSEKPFDQIPGILSGYDLLILPRPRNLQTDFGFSTKLAEYLASSVPTLATIVSDNDLYIVDGENGFLCKPNNIEQMSRKIQEIITLGNDEMYRIGRAGRKTAFNHFTISKHQSLMNSFFFQ